MSSKNSISESEQSTISDNNNEHFISRYHKCGRCRQFFRGCRCNNRMYRSYKRGCMCKTIITFALVLIIAWLVYRIMSQKNRNYF
jgi:hypothetical protein